ncbi:MAG TPA: GNAT family N-acetyltransferase [Thermoleophilaceae bacterium]|jgi:RimJ/RimL family protein N-acetyltransferase
MEPITAALRDGSVVAIRQIEPDDKERLRAAFHRLSDESRRRRFMGPAEELAPEDLVYLTELDHRRHEALVAVDPESGDILGVARWVRQPGRREVAELAVAVVDDRQGQRMGSELVAAANRRAREEGIERYHAIVSTDNVQVIEALERNGAVRRGAQEDPEAIDFEVDVPGEGVGAGLAAGLRAAASGQLRMVGAAADWVRALVPWSRD